MNRRNATVLFLAIVLMSVGFLGVLFVGQLVNPPPAYIAVAVVDIPVGASLTEGMVAIDEVHMDGKVINALVSEAELPQFLGGVVVQPIQAFQPLPKAVVSVDGNPASANRLALALADPGLVAMVVPVNQGTAPDAIHQGDYVDLNFGVGSNTAFGGMLSTSPTQSPFSSFSTFEQMPVDAEPTLGVSATPTSEPLLMLPVAKTVVSNAQVLAVIREERTATVQAEGDPAPRTVTVDGKIIALVVAIPREAQELLEFAIDNGTVRVALLSARLNGDDLASRSPSLGMTWNDLVSLVRMEREAALAQGLPAEVIGPGAFAVEATRSAATQAAVQLLTATPAPTGTPTPTEP